MALWPFSTTVQPDADEEPWTHARTLADLGELTAQWLEGRLPTVPGYGGPVDVDEDIAPGMTAALAAANRAGFVTWQSQGGAHEGDPVGWPFADTAPPNWPGVMLGDQQACVNGFADDATLGWLGAVASEGFALAFVPARRRWRRRQDRGWPTGWQRSTAELADSWVGYGICHPDAVTALCGAWQVTLYDVVPGRNDLWQVLGDYASTVVSA